MSFLIFASPKSGTTWLQRLISQHPEAICAESRAFGDYYAARPSGRPQLTLEKYCGILGDYFAPAVDELKQGGKTFYRALLFNFLDTIAATALGAVKKSVYGEKFTPYRGTAQHAIEVLHQYNPNIKFVNLTRDGRDVITSGAAHWLNLRLRQSPPEGRERFETALRERMILPEDFALFLNCWTEAARAGLAAKKQFPHYLHIKYEDFLADPYSQATLLFDFLGLNFAPSIVETCVEATAFDHLSGGRMPGEEDRNNFFRKGMSGDWENWFTAEQQTAFDEAGGDLLAELDYAFEPDPGTVPKYHELIESQHI